MRQRDRDVPSAVSTEKREAQEALVVRGGLLFGAFVLAAQNKGTRPRGRTPRL